MSKNVLDPYRLFNITHKSSLRDLRKSYHKKALLCHPDKGGSEKYMAILTKAYKFIEIQLKNNNNITDKDELTRAFKRYSMFEDVQIPKMVEIVSMEQELMQQELMSTKFNKKFNDLFTQKNKKTTTGYNNFMVKSEYKNTKSFDELKQKFNNPFSTNLDKRNKDVFKQVKHFKAAEYGMVLYKGLGTAGSSGPGCDYRTAFTDTTKELKFLQDDYKQNYKPKTLEDYQKERSLSFTTEDLSESDLCESDINKYLKKRMNK